MFVLAGWQFWLFDLLAGRQPGWQGSLGGMAGRVGWLAWLAGLAGWRGGLRWLSKLVGLNA